MIICTGRFRQRFASAVGNRALNSGPDAYLPLSYHEYRFHELILNSSINGLKYRGNFFNFQRNLYKYRSINIKKRIEINFRDVFSTEKDRER